MYTTNISYCTYFVLLLAFFNNNAIRKAIIHPFFIFFYQEYKNTAVSNCVSSVIKPAILPIISTVAGPVKYNSTLHCHLETTRNVLVKNCV